MDYLFLIPGAACLFLGVMFVVVFRGSRKLQERADRVITAPVQAKLTGTGSRRSTDFDEKACTVYYGIYEYDIPDGRHICSESNFSYGDEQDIPGTDGNLVNILYNPDNPVEFMIPSERLVNMSVTPKFKKIGIGLIILGVVLLVAAIAAMLGCFGPLLDKLEEGSVSVTYSTTVG